MYARTTIVRGDPAAVEAGIEHVRDHVWPMLQHMSGCVGMSMLADRDQGRCIVTTAWADESAMHASAEPMKDSRRQAAEVLRADSVEVGEWQIALVHRMHPSAGGAATRVIWTDLAPGSADGLADHVRMGLLSQLEDIPGFCSISLLVDLTGEHAVAAVTYDSRDAMMRSRERAAALRDGTGPSMGMTITEVDEFDLVLAHLRVPEMA